MLAKWNIHSNEKYAVQNGLRGALLAGESVSVLIRHVGDQIDVRHIRAQDLPIQSSAKQNKRWMHEYELF